jgi:hypothetical protein
MISPLSRIKVATARRSRRATVAVAVLMSNFDKVRRHLLSCLAREGGTVVCRFPTG